MNIIETLRRKRVSVVVKDLKQPFLNQGSFKSSAGCGTDYQSQKAHSLFSIFQSQLSWQTAARYVDSSQVGNLFNCNMLEAVRSLRDVIVDKLDDNKTGDGPPSQFSLPNTHC